MIYTFYINIDQNINQVVKQLNDINFLFIKVLSSKNRDILIFHWDIFRNEPFKIFNSNMKVKVLVLSRVWLFVIPQTVARQAPLSI